MQCCGERGGRERVVSSADGSRRIAADRTTSLAMRKERSGAAAARGGRCDPVIFPM